MPRNPTTGVYSKPAGTTPSVGQPIDPVPWNALTTDLGNEITNSLPRDGSAPMVAPLKHADGTQAGPAISFSSDITTGIFRKAAGVGAFVASGAEIANWSSAGFAIAGDGTVGGDLSVAGGLTFETISGEAFRGYLYGLTLTPSAVDSANDIDIAPGNAASDGTPPFITTLASILTKRIDAAWALGSGNGGLDTGAVANGNYYVWLIQRSDTSVVDALISLSSTAPTMPANYDRKRLLPWVIARVGGVSLLSRTDEIWEPIEIATVSGVTSWARTNLSAFRELRIKYSLSVDTTTAAIIAQLSSDNGSNWIGGVSDYFLQYIAGQISSPGSGNLQSASWPLSLGSNIGIGVNNGGARGALCISDFNKARWAGLDGTIGYQIVTSGALTAATIFGGLINTTARNAIKISAAQAFSGRIELEGVRG